MLYQIDDIKTRLRKIQEIPDRLFKELPNHIAFNEDCLPFWFKRAYGNRIDGLYSKIESFFNAVKSSGHEVAISDGYNHAKDVYAHCTDMTSQLFYIEQIDVSLFTLAKDMFHHLYESLDDHWFQKFSGTSVTDYLIAFKRKNRINVCPFCGVEPIKSNPHETREALDHWMCKAKYPFTSVLKENLTPMGRGCNQPPNKGDKEVVWTDKERTSRQLFIYPFQWNGEIQIDFICNREPSADSLDYGGWQVLFKGSDLDHQSLIDKWDSFFDVSNRWIKQNLHDFISSWTDALGDKFIEDDSDPENDSVYSETLRSMLTSKANHDINPTNRIEYYFLNFVINSATTELYNGYRKLTIEYVKNQRKSFFKAS